MNDYRTEYGYFAAEGSEYVITNPNTPMPWVNVICPGRYGVVISQAGGGFSWLDHAGLNRLTRWQQDLIKDEQGKYIFIKDEESGKIWSVTFQPVKAEYEQYNCIQGIGYTKFINKTDGIKTSLTIFVPPDDSLEVWALNITNESGRPRKLKVISYLEWCLDAAPSVEFRELHNLFIETRALSCGDILASKRVWSSVSKDGEWFKPRKAYNWITGARK